MIVLNLLNSLKKSVAFTSWKKEHENSFVSHFFAPISPEFKQKDSWEIGYYMIDSQKVTTFMQEKEEWNLKSSDQLVAHTGTEDVTKLDLSSVKISFEDALIKIRNLIEKEFPGNIGILGEGFCILQQYKGAVLWNVSFITQKMTMINIKISAVSSEFVSKDEINFMGQ